MTSLVGSMQEPVTPNGCLLCLIIEFAIHEAPESLHFVHHQASRNFPVIDGNNARGATQRGAPASKQHLQIDERQ